MTVIEQTGVPSVRGNHKLVRVGVLLWGIPVDAVVRVGTRRTWVLDADDLVHALTVREGHVCELRLTAREREHARRHLFGD